MTSATQFVLNNPNPDPILSMSAPPENTITFHSGKSEILKVSEEGFYVRGKKVPVDENESIAVYKAFKAFLVEHALTRNY